MLHIKRRSLDTVEDIRKSLVDAIRLELATMPVYLTALYSIRPGHNVEIAAILRNVAMEEMLHFCLACNVLNAIGGEPTINTPGFMIPFPGPLPGNIGTQPGKPFIVPIERLSLGLVRKVFMVIEEPEDPLRFRAHAPKQHEYHTIGEFYEAVEKEIVARGDRIFTGDPRRQVVGRFGHNEAFPVTDVDSAKKAIDVIIEQGEGTKKSPLDLEHGLAHYYCFAEIVNGRHLVPSRKDPKGWAYAGAKIPFDPKGVYPMTDNPALVPLPKDDIVSQYADQFDGTFTTLLNALHVSVNGDPDHLRSAVGVMYSLRIQAQRLMTTPIPGKNVTAGPRWKFVGAA